MKKVCLIIHSLGIGGMERVMAQLAKNFSCRDGVKVHLILIGRDRKVLYDIPDSVSVHKPNFLFNNTRRTFDTIKTIFFLYRKVQQIQPDTILSFGEIWNNLVLLALYSYKGPIYISDRSQPNKDLGRLHNYLRQWLYPKAKGYIAQTKIAEEVCLANKWNSNVCVIGNPIQNMDIDDHIPRENIVLSVGRLIKTKHFDQLIKMFVEINNPDWKLVIVGGDAKKLQLSKELSRLVRGLDAENKVFLEGQQQNINQYFNKSKIFAFTSSSEGFPNVIGEAMSAELPVIAYDCTAGPSDMIKDKKNGYLIPLFDQDLFKKKLYQLMHDEYQRKQFGKQAKKDIKDYEPLSIAGKFFDFIMATKSTEPTYEEVV